MSVAVDTGSSAYICDFPLNTVQDDKIVSGKEGMNKKLQDTVLCF